MGSEEFASCKVVRGSAGVDPTNTDDAATVAAIEQPIRKPSFNRYSDEFVVLAGELSFRHDGSRAHLFRAPLKLRSATTRGIESRAKVVAPGSTPKSILQFLYALIYGY